MKRKPLRDTQPEPEASQTSHTLETCKHLKHRDLYVEENGCIIIILFLLQSTGLRNKRSED